MKSLLKKINSFEETQDRINALKDACKDETAYLITCGPSLTTHNREKLIKKLDLSLIHI